MGERRVRVPKPKPGVLEARWGKASRGDEESIVYVHGGGGSSKPDGRILCRALEDLHVHDGRSLAEELLARGYDLTTLRFSIKLREPPVNVPPQAHSPQDDTMKGIDP